MKSHFEHDGTQNYLIFQPVYKHFKRINPNDSHIALWKSKGLSDESIKPPTTTYNVLNTLLDYYGNKIRVKFNGSCLKQDKVTFAHRTIVNIYEISKRLNISSY